MYFLGKEAVPLIWDQETLQAVDGLLDDLELTNFGQLLEAYAFFPIIALATKAVIIPYGRFTSSR
jgi:hypothetical protein